MKRSTRKMVGLNDRGCRIGEWHPNAKLTEAQVDEILALRGERDTDGRHPWSYGALARRFGVGKSTIFDVCSGRYRSQFPVAWKRVEERAVARQPADDNAGHGP